MLMTRQVTQTLEKSLRDIPKIEYNGEIVAGSREQAWRSVARTRTG
jgi:hypothetical protein